MVERVGKSRVDRTSLVPSWIPEVLHMLLGCKFLMETARADVVK